MISEKKLDSVIIDVNNIEYEVIASMNTINKLPLMKENQKIYTYLYHREDAVLLYGFHDLAEKELFLELIKVNGIGPKGAIKILSGIGVEDFKKALETEDLSVLSKLPGVGKKTAQRIVLALQGKLISNTDNNYPSVSEEIIQSLELMGYDKSSIMRALSKIQITEDLTESDLMRQLIIELSTN